METTTETTHVNIATMTSVELEQHIADLELTHKVRVRTLKALLRARKFEEEARRALTGE